MSVRVALRVAYDGTDFRGFAANPDVPTVGGEIRHALAQVLQYEPIITCAGRTDAGVHARGQIVTVDVEGLRTPAEKLRRSLDQLTSESISIVDAWIVSPEFDARQSATARTYRYTVENRRIPDPLLRRYVWHVARPLDLAVMNKAAQQFVGLKDFSTFCRRKFVTLPSGEEIEATRMRRVHSVRWEIDHDEPEVLHMWVTASSFCQQMVRSIVGTLVDFGTGRCAPESLPEMFAAADRLMAGTVAPPLGLVFWNVTYGDYVADGDRPGELAPATS